MCTSTSESMRMRITYSGQKQALKVNGTDSVSDIIQLINKKILDDNSCMSIDDIVDNYSFHLGTKIFSINSSCLSQELKNVVSAKKFELRIVKNICGGTSSTFPSGTKTEKKTCVVFGDTHPCAKLGCGCWISFTAVRKLVEKAMDRNEVLICPGCNKLIEDVESTVELCSFDDDKEEKCIEELEKKLRVHKKNDGVLGDLGECPCPHCDINNRRTTLLEYRMTCAGCGKTFCYECEEPWKTSNKVVCGNKDCNTMEIQEDLQECGDLPSTNGRTWVDDFHKKFPNEPKIPFYRACIGCWNTSTVVSNCRHVTCSECKTYYCFACLKPMQGHDDYKCSQTKPAPRQTLV